MFVSTTRSSALLAVLLLVSTLHTFSLATEQSSLEPLHSVLLHLPLMVDSNSLVRTSNINPHFPAAWLGKSMGFWPPDALQCNATIHTNPKAANLLSICFNHSLPWYQLAIERGASQAELKCKNDDIAAYCLNMVGCLACTKSQFGSLHDALKIFLDSNAQACGRWATSWYPPLKCLPTVTPDMDQCVNVLKQKSSAETCQEDVQQKFANVDMEPTELLCEKAFEFNKCITGEACKYCPVQSADKWLNFSASFWSPKEAECTKWASDESKMECAAIISSTEKPLVPSTLIPGTLIPSTPASSDACELVLQKKGEVKRCGDEATLNFVQHPIKNAAEMPCKVLYYISDCTMKAACALCTVTPDFTANARKLLDAASLQLGCNQWSSDKPKLECTTSSSNTLLIVGIIIGVILILVVIGAVVIYCVCFSSSDKSGRSSKAGGGGRGSGRRSKVNSGIAGSTVGSKQQNSRVSGGAKPQSRVSGGGKQRSRVSGGAKQQSRAKQSSTAY